MRAAATLLTACAIAWLGVESSAAVKVRTQFTKSFDFSKAKTWSWHEGGPGEVKMARTADDDPEVVRQRAEPVIMEAVAAALPKRGLTAAAAGAPADLQIKYYVLITVGTDAQVIGQFLPAVAAWGLPPFAAATQSYKVIEQGSLVIDISANKEVVWRGIGQAELKPGQTRRSGRRSFARPSRRSSSTIRPSPERALALGPSSQQLAHPELSWTICLASGRKSWRARMARWPFGSIFSRRCRRFTRSSAASRTRASDKPPVLLGDVHRSLHRAELMRDGWKSVRNVFLLAIGMDLVYQITVLKGLRPVQGLLVAVCLAIVPYLIVRGPSIGSRGCSASGPRPLEPAPD